MKNRLFKGVIKVRQVLIFSSINSITLLTQIDSGRWDSLSLIPLPPVLTKIILYFVVVVKVRKTLLVGSFIIIGLSSGPISFIIDQNSLVGTTSVHTFLRCFGVVLVHPASFVE